MQPSQGPMSMVILLFLVPTIFSAIISPHGGYLSIDEGTDFYLECIGDDPRWILANRLTSENVRISTQLIELHRKSILYIQRMDLSLAGPYLCQTNQSISTIILQLTKRKADMTNQIRFMGTTTNQTVEHGNDVRLNCFAQYYSEKAMDSPYLPRILWFFERKQLYHDEEKYILGADSLVIRNFNYYDQGVYYCRAFITLKNDFLSKIYPILVQLRDPTLFINETFTSAMEKNKHCIEFNETIINNKTVSYCNTDGFISNQTCPNDQVWNEDYSQCVPPLNPNQVLRVLPNLRHVNVEAGRTYTFVCQSNDPRIEPEWIYANGTIIGPSLSPAQQITSYTLTETHALYLRLTPVVIGTFICRSRSAVVSIDREEVTIPPTSITLTAQMIAETNGITFHSSTLPEYHVRTNATLFVACRPEYFDFQLSVNSSTVPIASLLRMSDQQRFLLSDTIDGLLLDRITKNASGMYLCMGTLPLSSGLLTSYYPIMVFVSDP